MSRSPSRSTPFGRALRNVGWLLTGKGVGAVLSLAYLGLATRSLGVDRFGQFMVIFSTAQTVASFVSFQSWQVVVRYGMALLRDGEREALGRLVGFCALLDVGAGLIGCGLAAGAIAVMSPRFGWSPALAHDALLFCVVLLLSVRSTAVGILRLHDRFATGAVADAVTPIVRFLGALAAVLSGASVRGFLLAWGVAELLTALAYWWFAARAATGIAWRWTGLARVPREHPGLWQFAGITNLNATINAASKQAMVVAVGVASGAAAAGAYRLAFQLSQALARLSEMFSRGIFPEFTRAKTVDSAHLQQLFRQSTRLTVTVGAAICVLAPILGNPVIHLVGGAQYLGAYPLVVILSIAAALELMGTGFEPLLLGVGRARETLVVRCVGLIALVLAAVLLVPAAHENGAALATLASSAMTVLLFGRLAYREVFQVARRTAEPGALPPTT